MSMMISDSCVEVIEERNSTGGSSVVDFGEASINSFRSLVKAGILNLRCVRIPRNKSKQIDLIGSMERTYCPWSTLYLTLPDGRHT